MAEKAMSANCIPIGLVVGNTHLVMRRWASENNRAVYGSRTGAEVPKLNSQNRKFERVRLPQ